MDFGGVSSQVVSNYDKLFIYETISLHFNRHTSYTYHVIIVLKKFCGHHLRRNSWSRYCVYGIKFIEYNIIPC